MPHAASAGLRAGYAEHEPPPALRDHVVCFWMRRTVAEGPGVDGAGATPPSGGRAPIRVLPDNCVDLIVAFDGDGAATAVGAMTRPLLVGPPWPRLTIGVRFRPGHARAAFGVPGTELRDATVAWSELAPYAEAEIARLTAASSDGARLEALMALVARRLDRAAVAPAYIREAARRLTARAGGLRIAALADSLGVTRQQLARQFAVHVGLPPKAFARVARVRALLARADGTQRAGADAGRGTRPRRVPWARLAHELGFADQPHMVEEVRAIAGMTPTEWAAR